MKIGPKMQFILRVYQMTDAENAEDVERDREMVAAGLMSQREYDKRGPTRDVARRIRQRDNTSEWPRDPKTKIGRSIPMTEGRTVIGPICRKAKPSIERRAAIMIPKRANFTLEQQLLCTHPRDPDKQALPDAARR